MTETVSKPKRAKPQRGSFKGELFRQSRIWHGYLSAFAFLALIFFSVTGLFLNHPEWFKAKSHAHDVVVTLSPRALAAAKASPDPMKTLAAAVGAQTRLIGVYKSGEDIDGDAAIHFEGIKGSSDVIINVATGRAEVSTEGHDAITVINELHRGKNASRPWKWVIDLSAVVILALSLIGYVLFFSLRFRLRTSLILTAVSLGVLVGIFLFFTP